MAVRMLSAVALHASALRNRYDVEREDPEGPVLQRLASLDAAVARAAETIIEVVGDDQLARRLAGARNQSSADSEGED